MGIDIRPCSTPALVRRVAARADRATELMSDLLLSEVPHYRTLSTEQLNDVRATLRNGFSAAMVLWHQGRLAHANELGHFRANGAARAAEGRPLPSVLRAYRVGTLGAFEFVIREIGSELSADEVANFARIVLGFGDQLSDEATIGYVDASEHLAGHEGRARRELFEDWIAGRFASTESLLERAALLDITVPTRPTVVVAGSASSDERTVAERAHALRASLCPTGNEPHSIALISRGRVVLILDEVESRQLEAALTDSGLWAVAVAAAQVDGIPAAHACAIEVADLMSDGRLPRRLLVADGEARLVHQFVRSARSGGMGAADDVLGPLASPAASALLEALDAFLLTGNAIAAAKQLGIHPQTMRYRLRRIRVLTGRDPTVGWDRFLLEVALRSHQLAPDQARSVR